MKLLIAFALVLATVSAGLLPLEKPVHPRDFPASVLPKSRITNGQPAAPGQFFYQVGLTFSNIIKWWCGGSLISTRWVLTAAHCTNGAISVEVYLGATVRTSPQLTLTSRSFVQHADYNSVTLSNDISLVSINEISATSRIGVIRLPSIAPEYSTYAGQTAVASGWGKTSDTALTIATNLQYAYLTVIENSVCANTFGSLIVTAKTLCVATPNGVSTCNGDSGGPLVIDYVLIGVTSFGSLLGCTVEAPAGFTRVTAFLDWIKDNSGIYY